MEFYSCEDLKNLEREIVLLIKTNFTKFNLYKKEMRFRETGVVKPSIEELNDCIKINQLSIDILVKKEYVFTLLESIHYNLVRKMII